MLQEAEFSSLTRRTLCAQLVATPERLARLVALVRALTANFDLVRASELLKWVEDVRARVSPEAPSVIELQKQGRLAELDSRSLLVAVALAGNALEAPERFFRDDCLPLLIGKDRVQQAENAYWTDAVLTADVDRIAAWKLGCDIVVGCMSEIKARLRMHPNSRDVYEVAIRENEQGLRRLLRVTTTAEVNPARLPALRADPSEFESLLHGLLGAVIARRTLSDVRTRSPVLAIEVLARAIDGQYDYVPEEVRNDFRNYCTSVRAQKRGQQFEHVPLFSEDDERAVDRHSLSFVDAIHSDDTLRQLLADCEGQLGPELRTLRVLVLNPAADVKEISRRIGKTVTTVRRDLDALQAHKLLIRQKLLPRH